MYDNQEIEFCMKCGNPNPIEQEVCDCGGRSFIYGKNFTYENKKVVCSCGCDDFRSIIHLNMSKYHVQNYKCQECRNQIGTQVWIESEWN